MQSAIRVVGVFVTPVKSLRSRQVPQAMIDEFGLVGDRRFMVVDDNGVFLSQRDVPAMATLAAFQQMGQERSVLHLSASLDDRLELCVVYGHERKVVVQGSPVLANDQGDFVAKWLSDRLGRSCRLVHLGANHKRFALPDDTAPVAYVDDAPFLIISEASLLALNTRVQAGGHAAIPMSRFRPTIVVAGCEPFAENAWRKVRIGDGLGPWVEFEWIKWCKRCKITTVDQVEGRVIDKEPLASLAKIDSCRGPGGVYFGSYYRHTTLGRVANNDRVVVVE